MVKSAAISGAHVDESRIGWISRPQSDGRANTSYKRMHQSGRAELICLSRSFNRHPSKRFVLEV